MLKVAIKAVLKIGCAEKPEDEVTAYVRQDYTHEM
jgi:hypothetical protein